MCSSLVKCIFLLSFLIHTTICYQIIPIQLPFELKYPDALHWDAPTRSFYFVDLYSTIATICRYVWDAGIVICTTIEGETFPFFIIPLKCCKNHYAIGLGHFVKIVRWTGTNETAKVVRIAFSLEENSSSRLNKAIADPKGRFYGGTLTTDICAGPTNLGFYRYTKRSEVNRLPGNYQTTVGIAIDKRKKKLYHLDVCRGIEVFDWDPKTGSICNGNLLVNTGDNDFRLINLIGLNVDTDGNIYSGAFNGSRIMVYDSNTGLAIDVIQLPTELVLTPTFGGPYLNEIFVTTGTLPLNLRNGNIIDQQLTPQAGNIFRIIGYGKKGYAGSRIRV